MTESILLTVKKMLGIAEEYHAFDLDLIININSVFLTLNQLGIGPTNPFQITGDTEVWSGFVNPVEVPGVQTYVYLKTRLLFDPPTNSFLVDAIQKQIAEFEWRMNVQVDTDYLEDENQEILPEPDVGMSNHQETISGQPMELEEVEVMISRPVMHNMLSIRSIEKPKKVVTPESVRDAVDRLRKSK